MRKRYVITILTSWLLSFCGLVRAQDFAVKSFRSLPNDISAYINPVRDLNEEACALIKVVASDEFAFSSPLGIISRHSEVGEIWLYVPRGTRLLTIKHPSWGVLRDFRLPTALESRMTYELVIEPPLSARLQQQLNIKARPSQVSRRAFMQSLYPASLPYDKKARTPLPWEFAAEITASAGKNLLLPGLRVAIVKRHGFYVFGQSSFGSMPSTTAQCNADGSLTSENYTPYYNDKTKATAFLFAAGAVHRLSTHFYCYEGAGYGKYQLAWQTTDNEWIYNAARSKKGWAAEAGVGYRVKRLFLSAGAQTIAGKQWTGQIGVGIFFKQKEK